jgi:hypothetical protein
VTDPSSPTGAAWDGARIVTLVAAVVLVVSGAFKWLDGDPGVTGYNVPAKFLVDVEVAQEGLSIGALLLAVAIVGAIGGLVPRVWWLSVLVGAAVLVVVAVYVFQLGEFADLVRQNDPFASDIGRGDLIGVGVWVGTAAGVALLVGGLLMGRRDTGALPSGTNGA